MISQYAVFRQDTGAFVRGGMCSIYDIDNQASDGEIAVKVECHAEGMVFRDGNLAPAPRDLVRTRKELGRVVSEVLRGLLAAPIHFLGASFDADETARTRIAAMIARIQRGDGLPTGWMGWRDASNQQHWSQDDAATVLANLTALSRAIEDREQALLVASWTHKANIAALEDIDAILAYDTTAAW